jgi:SHS2 domain-containing protein
MFAVFEHTADLGVRVEAATLPAALADAARGLFTAREKGVRNLFHLFLDFNRSPVGKKVPDTFFSPG